MAALTTNGLTLGGASLMGLPALPSLPTFEGLPILPCAPKGRRSSVLFAMAPGSTGSLGASKVSAHMNMLGLGNVMVNESQSSSKSTHAPVRFVFNPVSGSVIRAAEAEAQALSPSSVYSTDAQCGGAPYSSSPMSFTAIQLPASPDAAISPVIPVQPYSTPLIEATTKAPMPPAGFSLIELNQSLSSLSNELGSLDDYHKLLTQYVAAQTARCGALQAELEHVEREARRSRLLAKLSRFERARANQETALVRRKSSGAKRLRKLRRGSDAQPAGPNHDGVRVFSRNLDNESLEHLGAGLSINMVMTSLPAPEASNAKGECSMDAAPLRTKSTGESFKQGGTWQKGSRFLETLRLKRRAL